MAEVMPLAELERRAGDIDLPDVLFQKISFFAQVTPAPSLYKYPGSVRLRFFRKGEALCQYGEAGWSAFYLLTRADVETLRTYPGQRLGALPAEQEKAAARLQQLEAEKKQLEQVVADTALAAQHKEMQKKLDKAQSEGDKLREMLRQLAVETAALPELMARLARQVRLPEETEDRQQVRERAGAALLQKLRAAEASGDTLRAGFLADLQAALPAKLRSTADSLELSEPDLAGVLRDLAFAQDGLQRQVIAQLPRPQQTAVERGWLSRIRQWVGGRKESPAGPAAISIDGPRAVDAKSRISSMFEGDLFGELSCLNRTPRATTVRAVNDCYVLEMLRNVLGLVWKAAAFKKRMESVLRQRLVETGLRQLSLFKDFTEQQLSWLGEKIELAPYPPGTLICDEHEEADCMYVIGRGIVKVMTNVSWLVPENAPLDGGALQNEIALWAKADDGPPAHLWKSLPAGVQQELLDTTANSAADSNRQARLIRALNNLIMNPALHLVPELRSLTSKHRLGSRVWQNLASGGKGGAEDMWLCNRLLLESIYGSSFPVWKAAAEAELPALLQANEVAKWSEFCAKLNGEDKKPGTPERRLWELLAEPARQAIGRAKSGPFTDADKQTVVAAVNTLLQAIPLLLLDEVHALVQKKPEVAKKVMDFLPGQRRWTDFDFQRWNRAINRLLLETLCPALQHASNTTGPDAILAYRSRDEAIGEMALVDQRPRSATCVAYNHPKNDPEDEVEDVLLFRISKHVYDQLLETAPELKTRLAAIVAARRGEGKQQRQTGGRGIDRSLLFSEHAAELGLIQGQQLMLIDLDRCTRCDECVQACRSTHNDDRSRLFLNGPRIDQFLVPSTCRSCLDPVCMIGCPVGSIHRGSKKEIRIENWCIGCELCSKQCPYGSIQMHGVSLVPEGKDGWRFRLGDPAGGATWTAPGGAPTGWSTGRAPFAWDRLFRETLGCNSETEKTPAVSAEKIVWFCLDFPLAVSQVQSNSEFSIALTTCDDRVRVWINGQELSTTEKAKEKGETATGLKRRIREFPIPRASALLRRGINRLAVQVQTGSANADKVLLDAQLDAQRKGVGGETDVKQVEKLAVVCDLCSTLRTGPACVTACPHDAAMRVNTRLELMKG